MRKLILLLFVVPIISFSQIQFICSLLSVTDVVVDTSSSIIDIAVYNDNIIGANYPHIAFTIDKLGDTLHTGNINLFGVMPQDTTSYSYSLNTNVSFSSNLFYPLSIYFVYSLSNTDTCILNYHPSCDSVFINYIQLDTNYVPHQIEFDVQTLGIHSNGNFGYGGFVLLNSFGDTVAYEDLSSAANVYGLMQYSTESRILALLQNINLPFNGFIHLVTGWFAGDRKTSCIYSVNINNTTSTNNTIFVTKKVIKIVDQLGRETFFKKNKLLFYKYSDGSVKKVINH